MKYCQKCKKVSVPFIKNSISTNGTQHYMCRECNTERFIIYRKTKRGKELTFRANYKSMKKYAYKQNSRKRVFYKIAHGQLIRPKQCPLCKENKMVEAHHTDYENDIFKWMCRQCHADEHRLLKQVVS